ncbi:MAG: acyl-CoA dehydrogenase [Actinomycetia bacterium]|nr:acyl-CoA dehydrogenase [Actinomycetes bacterium]
MAESLEEFTERAAAWLALHGEPLGASADGSGEGEIAWGEGEFSVAVFHDLTFDEEKAVLADAQRWQQLKATEGFHAITEDPERGGLGLTKNHARAFGALERNYRVPEGHESFSVTTDLISPTVAVFGTDEQKERFVASFLSARELCCQLFSEPGAGSDLAGLSCKADLDGDEWVINGQKVWSSGAQFCEWGLLIARTDVTAAKHKGMTAFLVPMDADGIEIRQIRQMSGGTSFNEVFFSDCRLPDSMRLGEAGEGWKVSLTTLGFERDHSDGSGAAGSDRPGGRWPQLLAMSRAMGVTDDPRVRDDLTRVYVHKRVEAMLNGRAAALAREGTPGPESSLGKLMWTEGLTLVGEVASRILGPRICADTGEWGTWEWGEHLLGAPGYRIAGGSDEIQRNIIGERVLGLPGEPRVDKGIPFTDVPR